MNAPLNLRDASLLKDACFIEGVWVGDAGTAVKNPATGAVIAEVPSLGADDATRAVEAASRALPGWARTLAKERAFVIRR